MIDVLCAMLLLIGLNFIFATRSKFRIFLWLYLASPIAGYILTESY